ncbi:MAG: hypothetical protein M0R03_12460 [Novosphingobium sp.]|nr:hypothetical protein [Novosphingobium sp.]
MSNELVDNFNDAVADLEDNFLNSSLIQDNKVLIPMGTALLRARMPNQSEQSIAEEYRNAKKLEIMRSGNCVTKKKLVVLLKESGVADIEELEDQKKKLVEDLQSVWINLAVRHSTEVVSIENFKEEEKMLRDKIKDISIEISNQLVESLETQLEKAYIERLTSMCIEKCMSDNIWVKKWETFEDYQKEDITVTDYAITYMTWLLLNMRG